MLIYKIVISMHSAELDALCTRQNISNRNNYHSISVCNVPVRREFWDVIFGRLQHNSGYAFKLLMTGFLEISHILRGADLEMMRMKVNRLYIFSNDFAMLCFCTNRQ